MKILNLYAGIGGNRKLWSGDIEVVAQFELIPKYIYGHPNFDNRFIAELIKLNDKPIDYDFCKRLEKAGLVTIKNRCDLRYQHPHNMWIRRLSFDLAKSKES